MLHNMTKLKKLPDAEFEVMKAIWSGNPPMTANEIMQQLPDEKEWRVQTLISLLTRLAGRGFLTSEKIGKERVYSPLIEKEEYLKFETDSFMEKVHQNSFLSFMTTLYEDNKINDNDLSELSDWINKQKDGHKND